MCDAIQIIAALQTAVIVALVFGSSKLHKALKLENKQLYEAYEQVLKDLRIAQARLDSQKGIQD